MSLQNSHDDDIESEDSAEWRHCGFLARRNGTRRSIFIHLDCLSATAAAGRGFGLRLLPIGKPPPEGRPTAKEICKDAAALLQALKRTGGFSAKEQDEFAMSVEALATLESSCPGEHSDADDLFDEVLSAGMGGWHCIGSRSGESVYQSFRTTIYARRDHGGERKWTVLERSRDGHGSCTITDDGSKDSIFVQFMREYYPYEVQECGDD